ncbi:MAG TPA: 50S ribosomal protein L18 [bacterium]|jgi:large subunit ribosomal protein L18|nr:50S ribosomal protein L18 [bacterium]HOD86728.1 50S ribosomal protein L18 [bacterium]HPW05712.1 50S ribosomal protein L18 [bacterium]HPY99790.1 50S ribosomal protein L18 [bacterium]HQB76000.1 50S ribosomal protein L18 [bacterium]
MMNIIKKEKARKQRRQDKVRAKISGTASRPRLNVFRSNRGLYLQLIDDVSGRTLASAHVRELKDKKLKKVEAAAALGKILAEKARALGIKEAVFDRSSYRYHGRVKAVAEAAREQGLVF